MKTKFHTGVILSCLLKAEEDFFEEVTTTEDCLLSSLADAIYESEIVSVDEYDVIHQLVFPWEGKHWAFHFTANDGVGYNSILGTRRPSLPWKPETTHFMCWEVTKVTKTIEVWEKVVYPVVSNAERHSDEWEEETDAFQASVPVITDEQLAERWPRIQPIVRKNGEAWFIEPVDPSKVAYTWSPEYRRKTPTLVVEAWQTVFITWSFQGFFKPSIRECLAQMPKELVDTCIAFEILDSPKVADDFYRDRETTLAFDAGYHTCMVAYYVRAEA